MENESEALDSNLRFVILCDVRQAAFTALSLSFPMGKRRGLDAMASGCDFFSRVLAFSLVAPSCFSWPLSELGDP